MRAWRDWSRSVSDYDQGVHEHQQGLLKEKEMAETAETQLHCDMQKCGAGCTEAEYQAACSESKATADKMGRGWRPRVWENLGWHWDLRYAQSGLQLHPSTVDGRWTAFLNAPSRMPGGKWVEDGRTPAEAIGAVLATARTEIAEHQSWVDAADGWDDWR